MSDNKRCMKENYDDDDAAATAKQTNNMNLNVVDDNKKKWINKETKSNNKVYKTEYWLYFHDLCTLIYCMIK